jgi:acetyl-CoA carboxylase carboxyltransferase component
MDVDWSVLENFESESFDFTPDFFPLDEITRVATPTGVVKFETNTKLDKRENKMSEEDWNLAINESLAIIERANGQPIVSREITEVDFAVEPNQNRYTIKNRPSSRRQHSTNQVWRDTAQLFPVLIF